jgi:hypothetical protein
MKKLLIALLFIAFGAQAGQGELRGGSTYEYKLRLMIPQIVGFSWGRP